MVEQPLVGLLDAEGTSWSSGLRARFAFKDELNTSQCLKKPHSTSNESLTFPMSRLSSEEEIRRLPPWPCMPIPPRFITQPWGAREYRRMAGKAWQQRWGCPVPGNAETETRTRIAGSNTSSLQAFPHKRQASPSTNARYSAGDEWEHGAEGRRAVEVRTAESREKERERQQQGDSQGDKQPYQWVTSPYTTAACLFVIATTAVISTEASDVLPAPPPEPDKPA
ncbi:hypothetical protein EYF80_031243 [Liparis tanakae]|uniref:Uncharacterized protein n=1 Tax=Liparis tanakae TaxID=230148 RepID=A0A4Z2GZ03_9TELE|nr:hypothetical protein EYF80_031243 [Liparis tanakae]